MVELVSVIGLLGSFTAASLFFPQVWKTFRTKKTKDLSYITIFLGVANGLFWTSYGFMKSDPFLYVTNSLLFIAAFSLAIIKKKYEGIK